MRIPFVVAALVASASLSAQQPAVKPFQDSPAASISQNLGITTVKIDYHRPAVKGRTIWGSLVPYKEVWRTGANDATTISLTDPARIGDQTLPAGTYSFFAIPDQENWTLIFNKTAKQWGAYDYKAADDALRIVVKPRYVGLQEYLSYELNPIAPDRLRAELSWEHQAVSFDMTFDVRGIYWAHLQTALAAAKPGEWLPYYQAGSYCLNNDLHLDQALAWADQSLAAKETPRNLFLKARLLKKTGKGAAGLPLVQKAIDLASPDPEAKELLEVMTKAKADWSK
jgi:hypothetical protein